jgi:hypothetical protein
MLDNNHWHHALLSEAPFQRQPFEALGNVRPLSFHERALQCVETIDVEKP